jgi:hypothetical protein
MDQRTHNHLANARRNESFATFLLRSYLNSRGQQPPPDQPVELLWCVVVAFYSAVHYVNAYLWEKYHFSPPNHAAREQRIYADPTLARIAVSYDTLKDWGMQARYDPVAQITDADAQHAIDELFQISDLVKRELRDH